MSIKHPIGSMVRLSARGRERYTNRRDNPHTEQGVITRHIQDYGCHVRWDNSATNGYYNEDLELAEKFPGELQVRVELWSLFEKVLVDLLNPAGVVPTKDNEQIIEFLRLRGHIQAVGGRCRIPYNEALYLGARWGHQTVDVYMR